MWRSVTRLDSTQYFLHGGRGGIMALFHTHTHTHRRACAHMHMCSCLSLFTHTHTHAHVRSRATAQKERDWKMSACVCQWVLAFITHQCQVCALIVLLAQSVRFAANIFFICLFDFMFMIAHYGIYTISYTGGCQQQNIPACTVHEDRM